MSLSFQYMPGDQGHLLIKQAKPAHKLGTLESHKCPWLARGVFPHVSRQGVFLSVQNVGNVIKGEMGPY